MYTSFNLTAGLMDYTSSSGITGLETSPHWFPVVVEGSEQNRSVTGFIVLVQQIIGDEPAALKHLNLNLDQKHQQRNLLWT